MKKALFLTLLTMNLTGCMALAGVGSVALLESLMPGKYVHTDAQNPDQSGYINQNYGDQMEEFRKIQKLQLEQFKKQNADAIENNITK